MKSWTLFLVIVLGGTQAIAAETPTAYRAGLACRRITPEEPLWLAGYANRSQPSQGVLDDLYAQALALEDGRGERAVLLAVDLCAMRSATVNDVCQKILDRTGLARKQILVNFSHTHSGPAVDLLDVGYPIPPEERKKIEAYTEEVKLQLVDLAVAAVNDLAPAELAFGVGTASFFENRRRLDDEGRYLGMGPNLQNHTDRDVPVLRIATPQGDLRALVFGAACHNVTLGGNSYKISGDYAGFARMHLETQLPGVQAIFVTGCGADANPNPRSTQDEEAWTARHGETLGIEVLEVLSGTMQPVVGPLRAEFVFVDLSLRQEPARSELEEMQSAPNWESHAVGLMLKALDRGETIPQTYSAPISVWQIGDCLTLVGLPEETVSEYVPLLKRALGAEGLWTAGYCNDVSGYLPTVKILLEGGYETRGLFGPAIGWFAPKSETEVIEAVCRLAKQVGRKVPPSASLDAEPVAWWRFEPDEPLVDHTGHGHALLTNHGAALSGGPAPSFESSASASFDGASYLEGEALQLPGTEKTGLTLAAWVKPDEAALQGARMIVCKWNNTAENDHFALFLKDGRPGFAVADGARGEGGLLGKTVLKADQWHFVAGTWDAVSRQYQVFVDGRLEPTVGYQGGKGINNSSMTTLKIGAEAVPGNERFYSGLIDEVMVFNAALNAAQLRPFFRP